MCVTTNIATMDQTQVFTMVTSQLHGGQPVHVTAYQNRALNLSDAPNCMILHFPSQGKVELVQGAQSTKGLMASITASLSPLVSNHARGFISKSAGQSHTAHVEEYGDYHVVIAEYAADMFMVIDQVPANRRPPITGQLQALVEWYGKTFPDYTFVLACFDGSVRPTHPIVVSYVPDNDDVVYCPGLDGHDGMIPEIGQPIKRDFKVAFAANDITLPHKVKFDQPAWWIPTSVAGFYDNRTDAPNGDYIVPLLNLQEGFDGQELVSDLVL